MSSPSRASLARAALPVLAIAVFVSTQIAVLAAAGDTLGYDFLAYHEAARRVLNGVPLYEFDQQRAGGFGLFYYPPTFVPLVLPFGLLDPAPATWAWIAAMVAALVGGVGLMPVKPSIRWAVLLLAGVSWPVVYAVKLGQVTPLLFLLGAIGWRAVAISASKAATPTLGHGASADASRAVGAFAMVGASAALGAAIKLQPGLLLVWALLTRRWTAVASGAVVLAILLALSLLLAGPESWLDYVALLRQVTDPVTTDHNVTPGTIAHGFGLSVVAATLVQAAVVVIGLLAFVLAAWRAEPGASFLVGLIVSQLISPVLWDHYATLLLLPVAWLLAERQWWAVGIALATSVPLVWLTPAAAYPILFGLTLAALLVLGIRSARTAPVLVQPLPAA